MGATLQGRRRPDNTDYADMARGDYCRHTWASGGPFWCIRDPAGRLGSLFTHKVTEHEDGTVTVSPSILDQRPGGWHGFLERGVWRECG